MLKIEDVLDQWLMIVLVPDHTAISDPLYETPCGNFPPPPHILFFGPELIYYAGAQYVGCYVLVKKGSEQDWKNKTITIPDKGAGQRIMLSQIKE